MHESYTITLSASALPRSSRAHFKIKISLFGGFEKAEFPPGGGKVSPTQTRQNVSLCQALRKRLFDKHRPP